MTPRRGSPAARACGARSGSRVEFQAANAVKIGVDDEDGDVRPPLVDDERGAAEDRPEAERGVRHGPEVGLEEHAPPTRRELGDDALVHGAGPALEEREHPEQERQHPRGRGQDRWRAEHGRPDHEAGEHLARAAGVAEVTRGHLDDDADHGRHRHREGDLGGAEADLAREVERARREDGPGAETVGERAQREDAQVAVHGDAPVGQRWGRRRRHALSPRPHISLDVKISDGGHIGATRFRPSHMVQGCTAPTGSSSTASSTCVTSEGW